MVFPLNSLIEKHIFPFPTHNLQIKNVVSQLPVRMLLFMFIIQMMLAKTGPEPMGRCFLTTICGQITRDNVRTKKM